MSLDLLKPQEGFVIKNMMRPWPLVHTPRRIAKTVCATHVDVINVPKHPRRVQYILMLWVVNQGLDLLQWLFVLMLLPLLLLLLHLQLLLWAMDMGTVLLLPDMLLSTVDAWGLVSMYGVQYFAALCLKHNCLLLFAPPSTQACSCYL